MFKKKFSLAAEADILNKLSLYLSANLSLSEALTMLEEQVESKHKRATFALWRNAIESGKSLSQAFASEAGMKVSNISFQAASLGEKSASLAGSLKAAHGQIQKLLGIKKKILGALAYPAAILLGTLGLVFGLLLFVFPKIIPLFQTLKVTLPLSTRILIGISQILSGYWWEIILVIIASVVTVVLLVTFSQKSNQFFQFALLRIPIVGRIIRIRILCGVFDSLHALLQGGEQLSQALTVVSETVKFTEYKTVLIFASGMVTEGKSLALFFRDKRKLFPSFISSLMVVGERTGNMENATKDLAEILQTELDDKLKILTAALEPILMVSMSFIIGFIALSIILPIYGITSHFQSV